MSSAFVKEEDGQWLHDLAPTMGALVNYLSHENNGIRVYEQQSAAEPVTGQEIHRMSNGLSYAIDASGKWEIVW